MRSGGGVDSVAPRLDYETTSPTCLRAGKTADDKDLDQDKQFYEPEDRVITTPLDRPVLALVDTAALVGFAAVGKASHNSDGTIQVAAVLQTALPFLAAWFMTSPFTSVYNNNNNKTTKDGGSDDSNNLVITTIQQVVKGWIVAIPLGCALRGILKGYLPPTSFVIVTLIATLIILSMARILFTVVEDVFVELVN
jgi:hypothetical protein